MKSKPQVALLRWMIDKDEFTTHEVNNWGNENFFVSADRVKRHFASDGYLHALNKHEKIASGYNTRQGVYRVTSKAIEENLFIRLTI